MSSSSILRPFWQRIVGRAWVLSVILFVALASVRAYGLFGPVSARMLIMVGFFAMWFVPIIFLSKSGRRTIGLTKVAKPIWLLWAPLMGAAASLTIFGIGYLLYGDSSNNWYVSILNSWNIDESMMGMGRMTLFFMFAIPAMIFSPIGEEMFFRGVVYESFKEKWGPRIAMTANTLAFAAVHGLHHGFQPGNFHLVSGLLWVTLIAGVVWMFTLCRRKGGSIWPAVLCHAAYNVTMAATVIFVLL